MSIKQPKDIHGKNAYFRWPTNFASEHNANLERAQVVRDVEFFRQVMPYMPMGIDQGSNSLQKRSQELNATLAGTGEVGFAGPSARMLNEGYVMEGVDSGKAWANKGEKKVVRQPEQKLQFHGAPKRGAHWCERMWEEKGDAIDKATERAYKGGK